VKLTVPQPVRFPCSLWNPKVHYRVDNSPQLVPILSQKNTVHARRSYFSKTHFSLLGLRSGLVGERLILVKKKKASLVSVLRGTLYIEM
jgi:hypothetical protein